MSVHTSERQKQKDRYDVKNNIIIRYDDVEEAFADLNKEAQKLGFELSRISNFGMIFRDLDAKKAIYIIETEYEKGRRTLDGDNHFDAYHKFHELNSEEHEKNIAGRYERGGRTERGEYLAHQRARTAARHLENKRT